MWVKFTFAAVPVIAAAILLWLILGAAYLSLAPENMAGEENIGIILSLFGFCLFLSDRVAFVKMDSHSWIIIMKTWIWGLVFLVWGIVEWALVLETATALWFALHCLVLIAAVVLVFRWQMKKAPAAA